ncbi:MAG: hypothetical protein GDA47_00785 [Rhodospirillales bacterium]|nr:hypothetical protein [Rhodospirillales bacterium]
MPAGDKRKGFLETIVARLVALLIVVLGVALLVYGNGEGLQQDFEAPQAEEFSACVHDRIRVYADAHPEREPLTDFDRKLFLQRARASCGESR